MSEIYKKSENLPDLRLLCSFIRGILGFTEGTFLKTSQTYRYIKVETATRATNIFKIIKSISPLRQKSCQLSDNCIRIKETSILNVYLRIRENKWLYNIYENKDKPLEDLSCNDFISKYFEVLFQAHNTLQRSLNLARSKKKILQSELTELNLDFQRSNTEIEQLKKEVGDLKAKLESEEELTRKLKSDIEQNQAKRKRDYQSKVEIMPVKKRQKISDDDEEQKIFQKEVKLKLEEMEKKVKQVIDLAQNHMTCIPSGK